MGDAEEGLVRQVEDMEVLGEDAMGDEEEGLARQLEDTEVLGEDAMGDEEEGLARQVEETDVLGEDVPMLVAVVEAPEGGASTEEAKTEVGEEPGKIPEAESTAGSTDGTNDEEEEEEETSDEEVESALTEDVLTISELYKKKLKRLVALREKAYRRGQWNLDEDEDFRHCDQQLKAIREEMRNRSDFQYADRFAVLWLEEKQIEIQRSLSSTQEALFMGDQTAEEKVVRLAKVLELIRKDMVRIQTVARSSRVETLEELRHRSQRAETKVDQRMNYLFLTQSFMIGALAVTAQTMHDPQCDWEANILAYVMVIILPILGLVLSGMSLVILIPQFGWLLFTFDAHRMVYPDETERSGKRWTIYTYRFVVIVFFLAWLTMLGAALWFLAEAVNCTPTTATPSAGMP